MPRIRRWLGIALTIAVVVGLFWGTLRRVDPTALGAALKNAAQQRELAP